MAKEKNFVSQLKERQAARKPSLAAFQGPKRSFMKSRKDFEAMKPKALKEKV